MEKELLTIKDFIEMYSISRSDYYRQVKTGKLKIVFLGSVPRIKAEDAKAWANALLNK